MTCDLARESISAGIDGELDAAAEAELDEHLQTCASCQSYQDDAFALRRVLRMNLVDDDEPETATVDLVGSLQGVSVLRWALFVVGGTLVLLNIGSIMSPDGSAAAHLSRHDGVYGTALGVAMLAVAAKPHRAIGLVPLTSTITLLMAIAAAADLLNGNAKPLGEAIHIVEFAGLICLWVISGGPSRVPGHLATVAGFLPTRNLPDRRTDRGVTESDDVAATRPRPLPRR